MTSTAPSQAEEKRPSTLSMMLWPAVYLALRLAAPHAPAPEGPLPVVLSTVVFILVPLLWLRDVARMQPPPGAAVALFLLFALLWAEVLLGMPTGAVWALPWGRHADARMMMSTAARPFADLALITGAALLGAALSRIIRDPKMLVPVAIVGALVDYWGVYHGTTGYAVENLRGLVTNLSASIPAIGGAGTAAGLQPISYVGFGDWFFLSMFLAVAIRYDLSPRRTFWALLALLIPAMLLVLFGPLQTVPAVVPMAAAVLGVNWGRLRLTREETFATFYALLMVAAMVAVYTLVARSRMPRAATAIAAAPRSDAGAVVDRDESTAFRSAGPLAEGATITADFRRNATAGAVAVLFEPEPKKHPVPPDVSVEVSADGRTWRRIGSPKRNPARVPAGAGEFRLVRLVFRASTEPVAVAEILRTR